MFTPDALDALRNGNLSDLELSSDDEYVDPPSQQPQTVRLGADIVNRHQREFHPPESDDEEELHNRAELVFEGGTMPTPDFADCEAALLENPLEETSSTHNFEGLTPKSVGQKDIVKRWSKKDKRFIDVERPEIVKKYNHAMGGVDLLDQLLSYYRTFIKSKKWTLRMIFHASDLAVVQAFREYQIDNDLLGVPKNKKLTLLGFRRRLAESLVLYQKMSAAKRGRPTSSSPLPEVVPRRVGELRPGTDIARDAVGHFPVHDSGQTGTRCKLVGCKGRSRIKCIKCKVHLCLTKDKNCFLTFHT